VTLYVQFIIVHSKGTQQA